ncbi:MAG: hypothetical protein HFG58_11755 [Lachnospiraceae bacterium]|jgi:Predicted phosphatase homologous to the C-terminal domain of histone macroH2A1|nr:hypothetical protein [Lachnospiraceae bacterium]
MPFLLIRDDITRVAADAIVNPANPLLREGSGTSPAIHLAAGEAQLKRACERIGYCEMGRTIHEMVQLQKHLPESERAEKVIFVITTDGLENASREYSRDQVKRMIEYERDRYGWEFLFLGANMDAVAEAGSFGIQADRSVTFANDSQGIQTNYRVVGETISRMRGLSSMAPPIWAEWKQEIEKDFKKRGKRLFGRRERKS